MNIAIVADSSKEKELSTLVKKAYEVFGEAVFIPIEDIIIHSGNGRKVTYEKNNLASFDCVLPYPSGNPTSILPLLTALEDSNVYVPFDIKTYMKFQRRIVGLSILKENAIPIPEIYHAISENALKEVTENLIFPISIKVGDRSSLVEDKKHVKSLLRLRKPGQAITIEEPRSKNVTGCWAVNNELIASVEITRGKKEKMRFINVGDAEKELVFKTLKTLNAPYGYVILDREKIISFSLSPPLKIIEEETGKNVSEPLLQFLKSNIKPPQKKNFLESIIDAIRVKK